MAETAGLALGAVALLAGFKGAADGLQLLSDIYHSFEDASFYSAKFEIEKQRLSIWGEFFGFNDQSQCDKLRAQSEVAQSLVLYMLKEIEVATTSLDKLHTKYGLELVATKVKTTQNAHTQLRPKSNLLESLIEDQQKFNSKLKWWKKGTQYVLDVPKFEKLLDRLEYLNDSLDKVVPRVDLPLLTQGLASFLVPSNDMSYLQTFKSSSQQYVAMCAAAKQIKLTSTIMSKVPMIDSTFVSSASVAETLADGSVRAMALYQDPSTSIVQDIIIDWKEPNPNLNVIERDEVLKRIKGMCLLFREVSLNQDYRILPCLGLIEDHEYAQNHPGIKRHGFVFSYPSIDASTPESLYQSFGILKFVPTGDRFRLAQNLASGLLLLHSSKWLHKNICSQNVTMLKPKSRSQLQSTRYIVAPYLTGFAYSRPDSPGEVSLERPDRKGPFDFYRHPDFRKGHSRLNDFYSLGVVLFEIGHWKSIQSICDQMGQRFTSEMEVKDFLVANCMNGGPLGARMGDVFSSVVHRCLTGEFGVPVNTADDDALVRAFWSLAVRELDSCHA